MAKLARQARGSARILAVALALVATLAAPLAVPSAQAQFLPPPPIDPTWAFGLPGIPPFPGFGLPGISPLGAPWALPGAMTPPPPLPPAAPAPPPGGAPADTQRRSAVTIQDNFFLPAEITIPVGTMVTWTNRGRVAHTTTDAGVWDSGRIPPGGSFSAVFAVAGTFDYVCTIHPEMRGRVIVQVMAESTAAPTTAGAATTGAATTGTAAPPAAASAQAAAGAATTGAAAPTTPAAPAVAGQGATTATADLAAVNNSGVTGRATLTQTGTNTAVTVTLSGMAPGSAHAGHIHSGACSGPILFPLATITADSAGQGSATATVNAPIDLSNWWVQYHASDNPPGAPIACGQPRAGGM
ncbi:MAG TPA: cupredoxin family copper-binding protein [Chloroflexota bacterium]|nr:cupredoxin family copper-binding protein [Chloroflexota bacterium]